VLAEPTTSVRRTANGNTAGPNGRCRRGAVPGGDVPALDGRRADGEEPASDQRDALQRGERHADSGYLCRPKSVTIPTSSRRGLRQPKRAL